TEPLLRIALRSKEVGAKEVFIPLHLNEYLSPKQYNEFYWPTLKEVIVKLFELHDSISQGVQGLIFALHSLRHELDGPPQRVADILQHLEATARSTLDELRALIEELKPSLLVEQGLAASIQAASELFSQRQTIPVELAYELTALLSPEVEMTIYRIIQEALANIEKHAQAQQVTIRISDLEGQVLLSVKDDGQGFSLPRALRWADSTLRAAFMDGWLGNAALSGRHTMH
ncbi:MAG TPA: histidine kinase, partial [Oscillospiraceae bacterium]|nr:histidine kinase [Oscillospiraceae bacterium]